MHWRSIRTRRALCLRGRRSHVVGAPRAMRPVRGRCPITREGGQEEGEEGGGKGVRTRSSCGVLCLLSVLQRPRSDASGHVCLLFFSRFSTSLGVGCVFLQNEKDGGRARGSETRGRGHRRRSIKPAPCAVSVLQTPEPAPPSTSSLTSPPSTHQSLHHEVRRHSRVSCLRCHPCGRLTLGHAHDDRDDDDDDHCDRSPAHVDDLIRVVLDRPHPVLRVH